MRIGGLQKCSLIDYPGKLSCVVFTQGCRFRCPYCHNRELVLPEHYQATIREEDVMAFLETRWDYLEGVVITGGEPTEQEDLLPFLRRVKALGYFVKLDTNGSRPHIIRAVIEQGLADYLAMDIKTSFAKYRKAIGIDFPVELIEESVELIKSASIPHEFRTTVVQPFCDEDDVGEIASLLTGEKVYRLQAFRESSKMINPNLGKIDQVCARDLEVWEENLGIGIQRDGS